ncbi:MAG: hypothetical protein LBS31_08795 [Candidatus Adiutrix sp.]|jgi:predicted hotdog family 3-hydroxylacyl-ACP dehydratase|nr:hypothetical protein [Candidatus Adiutrix sp.]
MPPDFIPRKIEGLAPHRKPMLVVETLTFVHEDEARSSTVFPEDSLFLNAEGRVEEAVLFEMMAQTFAAFAAFGREGGAGPPAAGYLAQIRRINFNDGARPGEPVEITVRIQNQVDDFSVISGVARQGGRLLAEGGLTIFVPGGAL